MKYLSLFYTVVAAATTLASTSAFVPHFSPTTCRGMTSCLSMAESIEEATDDASERMEKSVDSVLQNMKSIRTGRASPDILSLVKVDYYGVETPINQVASIMAENSQQLCIVPFDQSMSQAIEKVIMESGVGTPQSDGQNIRLNIPQLTEERRKEFVKQCRAIGEDGKVAVRNVRRNAIDSIKKLEKNGEVSEDESKQSQDGIQKMTDAKVKAIDEIVSKKETQLMEV